MKTPSAAWLLLLALPPALWALPEEKHHHGGGDKVSESHERRDTEKKLRIPEGGRQEIPKGPEERRKHFREIFMRNITRKYGALDKRWPGSINDMGEAFDLVHEKASEKYGEDREALRDEMWKAMGGMRDFADAGLEYIQVERQARSRDRPIPREELREIQAQMDLAMRKKMGEYHVEVMDTGLGRIMSTVCSGECGKNHGQGTIADNPRRPEAWNWTAKQYQQSGDPKTAAELYSQALKLDPGNAQALTGRAAASFEMKDYPAAAGDARAALDKKPGDPAASAILKLADGRAPTDLGGGASAPYGAVGRGGSGAGAATRAGGSSAGAGFASSGGGRAGPLAAAPAGGAAYARESASLARQAQASLAMRDYASAVNYAGRAIELNPASAQAYFLRAQAFQRLRQYDKALRDAEEGLRSAPKDGALLNGKAAALNKLRRHREALEAASIALELNPNDANAYRNRAEALAGLGERDGMLAALGKAAELDPRFDPTLQAALQLPSDSDLLFLFDEEALPRRRTESPAGRRFGAVAVMSVIGGLLIAIGLLQFFAGPLKSTWLRSTSRSPALSSGAMPTPRPYARNGQLPGLLRGQYKTLRQIGAGGMGLVYEGTDVSLERRVAIKKMRDELRLDPRERERFLAEAKLVAALHHPNIVDIYSIVEEEGDIYLVFEFVQGKTIHELISAQRPLTFAEAMPLLRGIGAALDYAHARGVIHRDLKPSNVMVDAEGLAKVMDFGIARLAKDAMARFSMTNTVVGTPPYMAPEQEQGMVRREADIYALGICLYEALSGGLPFKGLAGGMLMNKVNRNYTPISKAAADLPRGLDEVLDQALDPDPDKRFHSAKEFLAHLDALAMPR